MGSIGRFLLAANNASIAAQNVVCPPAPFPGAAPSTNLISNILNSTSLAPALDQHVTNGICYSFHEPDKKKKANSLQVEVSLELYLSSHWHNGFHSLYAFPFYLSVSGF
jgi:hypothetical protein